MRKSLSVAALALASLATACSEPAAPIFAPDTPLYGKPTGEGGTSNPNTTWRLPVNATGLGLVSDGRFAVNGYSEYEHGVCGVSGTIFVGTGSGDATLQTNNPKNKTNTCAVRTMTVVYPAGDPVYPNGGTETMLVFLNLRNILNDATDIPIGGRVLRILSLNPTQTERCDAWRWSDETHNNTVHTGDKVWVERLTDVSGKRRYHVYSQDRKADGTADPAGYDTSGKPKNKATCTTTLQNHHLSVDFYIHEK